MSTDDRLLYSLYPEYPERLGNISMGVPFEMLNYDGLYIRVEGERGLHTIVTGRILNPLHFNDDGHHVPIVEIAGAKPGYLFFMSKSKPIRRWSGILQVKGQ